MVEHIKIKGFPQINLSKRWGGGLTENWITPCRKYIITKDYRIWNVESDNTPYKIVPFSDEYDTNEFTEKHSLIRFDTLDKGVEYYKNNLCTTK